MPQLAARARGRRFSAGGPELRVGAREQREAGVPAMGTAKPPGRGCGALPRWLLGAALLLGLRLCMELRHAGSGPPGRRDLRGPPRTHLLPAPGPLRGTRRRQVTYVRSGRRALPRGGVSTTPPEPSCCAQLGLPSRKVSCKSCRHGPWCLACTQMALGSLLLRSVDLSTGTSRLIYFLQLSSPWNFL